MQTPGKQALLGVQPVLGFIENDRLRSVDDLVGNFFPAVRRQAMHEQRIGLALAIRLALTW